MAGPQVNNLLLLDLSTGITRTIDAVGADELQVGVDLFLTSGANLRVSGNLLVEGTTFSTRSETVRIADNHLYLNDGYTVNSAQTGGLVVNYLPTTVNDTIISFTAGVPATSNPEIEIAGAGTFNPGDLIQVSSADNDVNNGLFEVLSQVGSTLTIRGIGVDAPTVDFVQNQFETGASGGTVTVVNVSILRAGTTGIWEVASGSNTTGLVFTPLAGVTGLQEAYEVGNTITTSLADGDIVFGGTQSFQATMGGSINLAASVASSFQTTASNLTLSTITSGVLTVSSAGNLVQSSAGSTSITSASGISLTTTAGAITATSDNSVAISSGNVGGAGAGQAINIVAADGGGVDTNGGSIVLRSGLRDGTGTSGTVTIEQQDTQNSPVLQLVSLGAGGSTSELFSGTSDPSGVVTAQTGSIFLRDTGTTGVAYLNVSSGGSGTAWEALVSGTVDLQTAYENGNTIVTSAADGDIDFSGTESFVVSMGNQVSIASTNAMNLNAGAALNVTSGLAMTFDSSQSVSISSGALTGGAGQNILLTAADADGASNDNGGSVIVEIGDGDGTGISGLFRVDQPGDESRPGMRMRVLGTNGATVDMFAGTSDPDTLITANAGSLFLRDEGTTGELYVNVSTGSGTDWARVFTSDNLTLQSAYEGGNTIVTDAANGVFSVSGTEGFTLASTGAASSITVTGEDLFVTGDNLELTATGGGINANIPNNGTFVLTSASNNYIDVDDSIATLTLGQFTEISENSAGVRLVAAENLAVGDVVRINSAGQVIRAVATTSNISEAYVCGTITAAVTTGNPVNVATIRGVLAPARFAVAPAAASNGSVVYLSGSTGLATLTPPVTSGNFVFHVGILQGADGASTTPNVILTPQFIAQIP